MTGLRVLLFRLRALVRARKMDREIDDEISSHLAEATEDSPAGSLPGGGAPGGAAEFRRRHADQGSLSAGVVVRVAVGTAA